MGAYLSQLWEKREWVYTSVFLLYVMKLIRKHGLKKLLGSLVSGAISAVPGAKGAVSREIEKEADKSVKQMLRVTEESKSVVSLTEMPDKGTSPKEVLRRLRALQTLDVQPQSGNTFAYVYAFGEEEKEEEDAEDMTHTQLTAKAFMLSMEKNGLNPMSFPSLRRCENEVVAMGIGLLHGGENARGTMTSGGTESICMAVKTAREYAKDKRGITQPNMVLPRSAHPAFEKASHFFGVETRYAPVGKDYRADVYEMRKLIDSNTIMLVGSAPQYAHGVIDPIEKIAALAKAKGILCHVDGCVGGWFLPFVEMTGRKLPPYDFRVSGVTSMSADVHKYGYAVKGASVILYASEEIRRYQFFAYSGWPGGLFVSPSMLGTRGGGSICAAWASLVHFGKEGFLKNCRKIMETSQYVQEGIKGIAGIELCGEPDMSIVAFKSSSPSLNVYAVADYMEDELGWNMERQQLPDSIHFSLMPVHHAHKERLIEDLSKAVAYVQAHPEMSTKGSAAMYGMVGKIPDESLVDDFLKSLMLRVFTNKD